MSPRVDSTNHMLHQRAAAEAARLHRQRPAEADSVVPALPPCTPRALAAAMPRQAPAAAGQCSGRVVPNAAGETPSRPAVSPAAAEVLRGGQREVSPEALEYLQGFADDDDAEKGAHCRLVTRG